MEDAGGDALSSQDLERRSKDSEAKSVDEVNRTAPLTSCELVCLTSTEGACRDFGSFHA